MKIRSPNSILRSNDNNHSRLTKSHQKQHNSHYHHPQPHFQQIRLPTMLTKTIQKDQSNLLSNSKSRVAYKQNLLSPPPLNNNTFQQDSRANISKSRLLMRQYFKQKIIQKLKQRKRHHSHCLWDEFKREIELFQEECGDGNGEVDGRIERLEMTVQIVKQVRKMFNGETEMALGYDDMTDQSEREFVMRQLCNMYQFRLDQKQQELRQLTRRCEILQKNKLERESHKSILRKSIRNHIEEMHGPAKVSDSRSSIIKDLFGVRKSFDESIQNDLNQFGERMLDLREIQKRRGDESEDGESQRSEKRQVVQQGFETGRFGVENEQGKYTVHVSNSQKIHKSRLISLNKLDQITVSPINILKHNCNTEHPSTLSQQLNTPLKNLNFVSNTISLTIPPNKKYLSISQQFSKTCNEQFFGCRLKSHKLLTKMIIELMTKSWNILSKVEKKDIKKNLSVISEKIAEYVRKFNEGYVQVKGNKGVVEQKYYNDNTKELKEIQERIVSVINQNIN